MHVNLGTIGIGLTTQLMMESEKSKHPILVVGIESAKRLKKAAKDEGINIPDPICIDSMRGMPYTNIIVDNADMILYSLLKDKGFRGNISTIGINCE